MIEFNEETHTYTINGIRLPSVTQIIADAGLYGDIVAFFTDYNRDRGSNVHKIIQWHLSKELDEDTVGIAERPYFDAWLRFESEANFVSEKYEKIMFDTKYGFAGTVDHVGKLNKWPCLIDTKTGTMTPATAIQLAGYEILANHPGIKRFGLQLMNTGKYKLIEFKDRSDRGIFLSAHALYSWKRNNLK